MKKPLRLLLVEDSDLDTAHLLLELRRGGFEPQLRRVETEDQFAAALHEGGWDAIIADYHLPRFSAPEALEVYRLSGLDIPFLVVSGAIGEETAVELMRAGAHDYLLKHHLTRLAAAVDRELQQAAARRAKRRAESLFHAVLRASALPSVLIDRITLNMVDGSDSFRKQFLGGAGVLRGLFDIIEFSQPERIEQLIARGSGTAWSAVYYSNGVARVANVRCYSVEHEGASYAYLLIEDVTEQHYLKAAFDAVPDPLLIVNSQQKLLYANRAAEEVFGNLYFGMDMTSVVRTPSQGEQIEIGNHLFEATPVPFRFAGEAETSTILTLHDVSAELELQHLAAHDPLTGVYNMRSFEEVVAGQLDEGGTLALLDLDHFKPINDELGHAAGDAALTAFTTLMSGEIRPTDVLGRLGGDEFAIFFPGTPPQTAIERIASIYARLARTPFRWDNATRALSVSCGLSEARAGDTPESLRRRADDALYEAKRQGRGRWVIARAPRSPAPLVPREAEARP